MNNDELVQVNKILQQLEAKLGRQRNAVDVTQRHLELVRAQRAEIEKKAAKKAT